MQEKKKIDPAPTVEFEGYTTREGVGYSSVQTFYEDDGLVPEHTIAVTVEARSVDGEPRGNPEELERWARAAAEGLAGCFRKQLGEEDPLSAQVERLATFVMARIPGEPSESQGAIDTVIRVLGRHYPSPVDNRKTTVEATVAIAVRWAFELSHDSWPDGLEDFGRRFRTALGKRMGRPLSMPFEFNPAAYELVLREEMLPIAEELGWFEGDAAEAVDAGVFVQRVLRSVVLEST